MPTNPSSKTIIFNVTPWSRSTNTITNNMASEKPR